MWFSACLEGIPQSEKLSLTSFLAEKSVNARWNTAPYPNTDFQNLRPMWSEKKMKLYSEIAKDKTEMPASMKAVRLLNIVQIQALETYIFLIKARALYHCFGRIVFNRNGVGIKENRIQLIK